MRSFVILTIVPSTSIVLAQIIGSTCCGIQPDSIALSSREFWCATELVSCPAVCGNTTISNQCDAQTLSYSCICNATYAPDMSIYTETIPYYLCTEWSNQCVVQSAGNDTFDLISCRATSCGTLNPNPRRAKSSSTIAIVESSATSVAPNNPPTPSQTRVSPAPMSSGLSSGAKGGIAAAVIIAFALLGGLIFYFVWWRKRRADATTERFEKPELETSEVKRSELDAPVRYELEGRSRSEVDGNAIHEVGVERDGSS
ncbi:hypothetical protein EJ08DRAFT_599835 [Tothia fuscella]|uniref:DUF7707 domain-containing protein n=1 Tax=Tothia fuscella TaxID=1048955 RepID=A0A9P4NF14_9PEZI|nr:hypothetical protein EJ08DRAFT_599835 [Tothia fuscella]